MDSWPLEQALAMGYIGAMGLCWLAWCVWDWRRGRG
jgi:hypothetical protein